MARDYAQMMADVPAFSVTHAARQMAAIVRRDEPDGAWRCRYCRVKVVQLDEPWSGSALPFPERDHVIPRLRGGSNAVANLVLACAGCNVRKGAKLLSELPPNWHTWRDARRPIAIRPGGPF